jgi:ring-1,2-phenylacetyl-CoA epoxidase subunit PaaD
VSSALATTTRCEAAWAVLSEVPDPEVPVISIRELGIVRDVFEDDGDPGQHAQTLHVVLTPTYSGCPATEVITQMVQQALLDAGLGPVRVTHRLSPAWTTDWIGPAAHEKLRRYGIAPPSGTAAMASSPQAIRLMTRLPCPRCGSQRTERLSAFGSTACKALHRCLACLEPFEHFKPI